MTLCTRRFDAGDRQRLARVKALALAAMAGLDPPPKHGAPASPALGTRPSAALAPAAKAAPASFPPLSDAAKLTAAGLAPAAVGVICRVLDRLAEVPDPSDSVVVAPRSGPAMVLQRGPWCSCTSEAGRSA